MITTLADGWSAALAGDRAPLEAMLAAESRLPGPRANLELAARFADLAGSASDQDRTAALGLLDDWLSCPATLAAEVPAGTEEYLSACAALAAGELGEYGLLTRAVGDTRWRVRELGATGMQRVLANDWEAGLTVVNSWLRGGDALLARGAVAAVAEPPLLRDPSHAADACRVLEDAVGSLLATPAEDRRDEGLRVLRKALGYAISVTVVATPDAGLALLEHLATRARSDADAAWIVRENLRKARLKPFEDRLVALRAAIG